jgi:NADPH:quinone reductase-like Zn-dependent oxidoreductase
MALLERELELARISARLALSRGGDGSVLLIEGAGGIGKTALLLAAEREARLNGMTVAGARGSELEREFAFGVVRQLLEPMLAAEDAEATLGGAAALAGVVFRPGDPEGAGGVAAGGEPSFAALHGLYWLCANLA